MVVSELSRLIILFSEIIFVLVCLVDGGEAVGGPFDNSYSCSKSFKKKF